MELREFAAQVLFGTTLEHKLQSPGPITDLNPGPTVTTPDLPGRPPDLRFKKIGEGRDSFPGVAHLEKEEHRGKLLHFFANHELLATELMALVLLKFPDAPPAFRLGVLRTLQDEQAHTRLYIERMRDCGIHFGALPLSGYFWRMVSPMANPLDYVTSLSLTFEQANLDFARHYSTAFARVGDLATANLLHGIYLDEIAHVAYGLRWFRKWKNPGESDWDAFCRQLKFPLSPQRAKGLTLNMEGRRAAGLDETFIANLNVYSQSKGRTPNVFWFNPLAEAFIAHGPGHQPPHILAQLALDLETLPQFLCRQDDIVLVESPPSVAFRVSIQAAGLPLPEFVPRSKLAHLTTRKLGRLRPWAWAPDSVALLTPLMKQLATETRTPEQSFHPGIAELYSKTWSARWLRSFLGEIENPEPWLCTTEVAGQTCSTVDEALQAVAHIRAGHHHRVVIKADFGAAGSNTIRLFEPQPTLTQIQWLKRQLCHGQGVVVEPWLDRVTDFSAQLEMSQEGLRLCGYTSLITNARGQFVANTATPGHSRQIPASVLAAFPDKPDLAARCLALYAKLFERLEMDLKKAGHIGPFGVDALVYKGADGLCRIKPVVEFNPRHTMGRLTLELMRHAAQGISGRLEIITSSRLRSEGFATFSLMAAARRTQFPLEWTAAEPRRILGGWLALNDPERAGAALAAFRYSKP